MDARSKAGPRSRCGRRASATGTATTFHATVEELEEGTGALTGMADLTGADGAILLADPVTFPTDAVLRFLTESSPMLPLLGGLASGRTLDDETVLFFGEEVVSDGAVGIRLDGVEVLPMVSQGAAPIGPEADDHRRRRPRDRRARRQARAARSCARRSRSSRPRTCGSCRAGCWSASSSTPTSPTTSRATSSYAASSAPTRRPARWRSPPTSIPGQVVRLHARDAESADHDLREALSIRMTALGGRTPAGALVFACNGRGRSMFGRADHDAEAISDALAGAPAAGFFAAGEIGPVGGGYFLHSFTATVAVFA